MNRTKLLLSGMRSLWGVLTPNVRKVSIDEVDNNISIYFYYDKIPSEIEQELAEDAATEVIADFPEPFLINCEKNVVPFPEKIEVSGFLIYSRFEDQDVHL